MKRPKDIRKISASWHALGRMPDAPKLYNVFPFDEILVLLTMLVIGLFVAFSTIFILDWCDFNNRTNSTYATLWYDNNMFHPYTLLRIHLNDSTREYWTTNFVGDRWYVRESDFNGATFWTILEKEQK